MKTVKEVIAANLKKLRPKGLNQRDLADKAGVGLRTYVALENGNSWPEYDNLRAIAMVLGVPESTLLLDPDLLPSAETDRLLQEFFRILAAIDDPYIRREFLKGAIDNGVGMGLSSMDTNHRKSEPPKQNTKVR